MSLTTSRGRLVRRVSVWERIIYYPIDFIIHFQEDLAIRDWDKIQHVLALLIGIILNAITIYLRLDNILDQKDYFYIGLESKIFSRIQISFIEWTLLFISIINSIYIPTKTKKYQLFDHDLNLQPQSMNIVIEELNLEQPGWSTKFPGSIFYPFYQQIFKSKVEADNTKFVWVLKQWDPPIFSLDLFCYFSPPQVICFQVCDKDNWRYIIPTALLIAAQLTILRKVFFSYVDDNLLLYGEMLKEYNNKVVYKRLFKVQYEFGTQTDDDNDKSDDIANNTGGSSIGRVKRRGKR